MATDRVILLTQTLQNDGEPAINAVTSMRK